MKLLLILMIAIGLSSTVYSPQSEAFRFNETPYSLYYCYHTTNGVRDPVPYSFVGPNTNCPPPPSTAKAHKNSVFVPKNTEFDHHCDTEKTANEP